VESDEGCSSHKRSESHFVPRRHAVNVVHVLAFVDVEVVQAVEHGKGSVEGPAHVSRVEHNTSLGVFGHKYILLVVGNEHARDSLFTHITFNYKNIIKGVSSVQLNI
jgi:hypothetical protein